MTEKALKILLVEDNADQEELVRYAFKKIDRPVLITVVQNGQIALELHDRDKFDVIILDYSLPKMNGLEVLKRLQKEGCITPIIMVTGQGNEKVAVEAMKLGAYDYIIKSRDYYKSLPMVVNNVIEKSRMERELNHASGRAHKLYEVSLAITHEKKLEAISEKIVKGACEIMQAEGAILLLVDNKTGELTFIKCLGLEIKEDILNTPINSAGLFSIAYNEKQSCVIEDADKHPLFQNTPICKPYLRQMVSVPLIFQEEVIGVIAIVNKQDREQFSAGDIDTFSTLALHSAVAIDSARSFEDMERRAMTDSLTGLYNHREFQKRLAEEVERAKRYGKELSLLMIDIDHFKKINDTYGHPAGDLILKEIAKIFKKTLRNVDFTARYGGEEFSVILPETIGDGTQIIAERIRQEINDTLITVQSGHQVELSVSIGASSFPLDATEHDKLIATADQALYFAKKEGRNRVCYYSETLKSHLESDEASLASILRNPQMEMIHSLATAIDAKTPYTRGHTEGVLKYANLLADALQIKSEEKKDLTLASILHNFGMINIPENVLNKQTPLSLEEQRIIQSHPLLVEMMFKGFDNFEMESVLPAILYHHERYDGKGYPKGLEGDEIPFLARVLGIVEAYHAMISVRSYRPRLSQQEAIEELEKNSGKQFDPKITEIFVDVLRSQSEN